MKKENQLDVEDSLPSEQELSFYINGNEHSLKQLFKASDYFNPPEENEFKTYLLRFFLISQMDFKFSIMEMVMLLIHPKKEYPKLFLLFYKDP